MTAVWNIIKATAPLVALGSCLVIIVVRSAINKNGKKRGNNYDTEGMSLGMCFGLLIGTALGENAGVGVSIGMLAGLIIGMCIPKSPEDHGK